jgi:hypothetical protein
LRKAIFIFLGLLLALSMFSFPADTINAQTITTPQLAPSSPAAMQVGEKELIDDILRELDQARKLTNDKDIQNQIGVIKEWVKKVQTLAERGETKAALEIKYTIAKRLEWLINQLPTVTPGATTAVATTTATNPLYDELVRIRAKIDRLIELEEREIPTITPYEPPEIQRPPEMEKLIVYSAKFLCGPAFGGEGVQPGSYSTAINVHNPHNDTIYLFKKAVIAQREDEPRGRISNFRRVALGPDEAIEIDCIDIVRLFGAQQETGVTAPTQQTQTLLQTTNVTPISSLVSFIKGFVVIYATAPLDVVGVYTASTPVGFSLDVEYISFSTVGVRPILIPEEPEEEAECPTGCYCLTKEEAGKRGYTALCQEKSCGTDTSGVLMYCWKPAEQVQCPQGCACVTEAEANKYGYTWCQNQKIPCGKDATGALLYCFQKPVEQACTQGCYCLTADDAKQRGYTDRCTDQPCGYDQYKNPMYCYKPPTQVQCPQGCVCATFDEAKKYGYVYCQNQQVQCGTDKYCFQRAAPTEVKPTPGRILIDPTQARNPVGTQHTITVVVYDTNGKPMANVRVKISHTGANSFSPIELTTDGNGKVSYYYTGKNTGTDTIVATVDSLSAKATKEWYRLTTPTPR